MDYRVNSESGCVVHIGGRLTFNDFDRMRGMVGDVGRRSDSRVVFDLSTLDFIDSSGLGMLLIASEELGKKDKTLALRGARGQVQKVLAVAELGRVLEIEG